MPIKPQAVPGSRVQPQTSYQRERDFVAAATLGSDGGRGGIRTHGEFNPTLDFESSALNRTQPPFLSVRSFRIEV